MSIQNVLSNGVYAISKINPQKMVPHLFYHQFIQDTVASYLRWRSLYRPREVATGIAPSDPIVFRLALKAFPFFSEHARKELSRLADSKGCTKGLDNTITRCVNEAIQKSCRGRLIQKDPSVKYRKYLQLHELTKIFSSLCSNFRNRVTRISLVASEYLCSLSDSDMTQLLACFPKAKDVFRIFLKKQHPNLSYLEISNTGLVQVFVELPENMQFPSLEYIGFSEDDFENIEQVQGVIDGCPNLSDEVKRVLHYFLS